MPRRGPNHLGKIGIGRSFEREQRGTAEGVGRTDECPEIPGVGEAYRGARQGAFTGDSFDQLGDAPRPDMGDRHHTTQLLDVRNPTKQIARHVMYRNVELGDVANDGGDAFLEGALAENELLGDDDERLDPEVFV